MKCYLEAVERCEECGGLGWIEHPAWIDFYMDERYSALYELPPRNELKRWFKAHGYDEIPHEHITCPTCGGEGFTHRRVLLREALEELGVEMPYKNWGL